MKYVLITILVIFTVWLFDAMPVTTSITGYRAYCNGGLITYSSCHGELAIGESHSFVTSSHRNEVLRVVSGSLPQSLGTCKIQNRKNWSCKKLNYNGKVDFYWMTNSLYVHNNNGKETSIAKNNTLPILRKEWVKLYVTSIPSRIVNWLESSKYEYFQRKVQAVTNN